MIMESVIQSITSLPKQDFITDLAIIMILAAIITLAFFKIKQPLIIGYLFVGMLIGPLSPIWVPFVSGPIDYTATTGPGILSNLNIINVFADIGIILLLFVIGIEFPIERIKSIGKAGIGIATIELFLALGSILGICLALGLQFMDSLFLAAALSISSTAVIIKILEDMGRIKNESTLLILGILIVEDIIAVILLASLQSIAHAGNLSYESIAIVAATGAILIVGTLTIGAKTIPKLIDKVASVHNKEILLLSVLGLCFGYALLSNLVGLSVGIGAFLAGVLVAESRSSEVSKILTSPIKDMFVAVFFVSVGALMDISQLKNYIMVTILLIAVSIIVKAFGTTIAGMIFRQGRTKIVRSSIALSPRGEFSIVIIKAGIDMGAVSAFLFPLIGVISVVSAFLTPFLIKAGDRFISKTTEIVD